MKLRALCAGCALSGLILGCTSLPVIAKDQCGNGVIEAPEDCDTFAPGPGLVCRPKDSIGGCHLDCSPRDGAPGACFDGWGCDGDFICRKPSGTFGAPSNPLDVGAWTLASGDFDGDGRADVMSLEPPDAIGETRLRFHYFDEFGQLAETRLFPKSVISPTISDLSKDGLSDVAFSNGWLGVMLGRSDRSWVPETFSSYRVTGSSVRVVPAHDNQIENSTPIVTLIDFPATSEHAAGLGFVVADDATKKLASRALLWAPIADLAGDPVSGNLLEDAQDSPCLEPLLAVRGASHFTFLNTCSRDASGSVLWRSEFELTDVALDPPAPIDAAPQIVDLDGDGHLDVLVGARGRPYVSYGDGATFAKAVPYRVPLANPGQVSADIEMPIAVGDFSGDGAPDFVFGDHLLISSRAPNSPLFAYSEGVRNHLGSPWTAAKIADFNGNGKVDLITASNASLNLEFFNGSGSASLSATLISTGAPVRFLEAGDFDGDQITDLAFLEAAPSGQTRSALKVAFGGASAVPAAPVTIAQLSAAEALVSYQDRGISNLVVASNQTISGEAGGALALLDGSSDRLPFAPFALTEFESSGNVEDSVAIAVAAGHFSQSGGGDLFALAFHAPEQPSDPPPATQPWLLPAVETPEAYPRRLSDAIDPVLQPTHFLDQYRDFSADVASTAADLDGDGLDEALFVMPAGSPPSQCAIVSFKLDSSPSPEPLAPQLSSSLPVLLDDPCPDPQVVALDADHDGHLDIALLTGRASDDDRKLYVLWNDGAGGFSSGARTLLSGSDAPQAFTVLPASPSQPLGFAYVTRDTLRLVRASAMPREFADAETRLDDVQGGTGIVAADVNGDRVTDLVLAESGRLRVLQAELIRP